MGRWILSLGGFALCLIIAKVFGFTWMLSVGLFWVFIVEPQPRYSAADMKADIKMLHFTRPDNPYRKETQ